MTLNDELSMMVFPGLGSRELRRDSRVQIVSLVGGWSRWTRMKVGVLKKGRQQGGLYLVTRLLYFLLRRGVR